MGLYTAATCKKDKNVTRNRFPEFSDTVEKFPLYCTLSILKLLLYLIYPKPLIY